MFGAGMASTAQEQAGLHTCAAAQGVDEASLASADTVDEQVVTVTRPAVVRCLPALEAQIDAFVEDYTRQSVLFGTEFSDTERDEFRAMAREAREAGYAWSHDIAITQEFGNDRLVSLLAAVWSYTGGAHGNLFFAGIVFDVEAGRTIALEDLFEPETPWLDPIAAFVRADLYRQKREMGSFEGAEGEDPFIEEGAVAEPQNFEAFGIYGDAKGDAKGLRFHFAPYSVGAFAEGDFHVNVPAVVFDAFLRDDRRTMFR
jgi:hypothetical protein